MDYLSRIIRESIEAELRKARKAIDTNPTDAEIKAGNYAKGHVKILGFNITIENPKGSYRKGKDKNGKEWKTLMRNDYGYFVRTLGKDGDAIDVFIGPNLNSTKIFPVDQYINGEFDETKIMLGFDSKEQAKKAYLSNYEKNWKGFKYISEVDIDEFKTWLYDGKKQRKPFAKYISLTENINITKALKSLKKRRDPANIENWDNMVNENFSSQLLAKYAKEHGGLKVGRNGGLRDGVRAYHGGGKIDPAKVTDDMLQGEPYKYDWQNSTEEEYNNSIHFADDYAVMLKPYDHKRDDNINVPSQRKKPSRYYTGVGDTGDHDKSKGGFVGKGKDNVSAPYNGFSVSSRAGEAQHYREALKNNHNDINYIQNHKEHYKDWPEKVNTANKNISAIKKHAKELLNKPKTINESELRKIIRESIEEFYKGDQNEKIAYENACDCLYYGYGFKFWFERNAELLNHDAVIAKDIWKQAVNDVGNNY